MKWGGAAKRGGGGTSVPDNCQLQTDKHEHDKIKHEKKSKSKASNNNEHFKRVTFAHCDCSKLRVLIHTSRLPPPPPRGRHVDFSLMSRHLHVANPLFLHALHPPPPTHPSWTEHTVFSQCLSTHLPPILHISPPLSFPYPSPNCPPTFFLTACASWRSLLEHSLSPAPPPNFLPPPTTPCPDTTHPTRPRLTNICPSPPPPVSLCFMARQHHFLPSPAALLLWESLLSARLATKESKKKTRMHKAQMDE